MIIYSWLITKQKKEKKPSYHIRQSLGIACVALGLSVIAVIPILGWIISFLGFFLVLVLWIMGLINALSGNEKPVPVLGKKFEKWFKDVN